MTTCDQLNDRIVACRLCPRLRDYCAKVAAEKRAAYAEWAYWGRPVPNFGDARARLLIVGLAPAAHGANRTGRMFTGDRSGDWLYRALYEAGFANQPHALNQADGLQLKDCVITAVCHCAPPANRPTPAEIRNCQTWLRATLELVPARVYLALGHQAWQALLREARTQAWVFNRVPAFRHGAVVALSAQRWLVGSYHPSQQNTFTGRLTHSMWRDVFASVRRLLDEPGSTAQ